ncbi:Ankyrin-2 [Colletotrichum sp. SAR 10_75]|nr:Ankyrin-2 [Colletotrichum sp. SAR 10_75]
MDAIGTVTSAIELCKITKDLIEKYANAGQDVTQLRAERNWTERLCVALKELILKNPNMERDTNSSDVELLGSFIDTATDIESTLQILEKKLRGVNIDASDKVWQKTYIRAYWVFNEGFFKDTMQSLRNQREMMNSVVMALNLRQSLHVTGILKPPRSSSPMPPKDDLKPYHKKPGERDSRSYAEDLLKAVKSDSYNTVKEVLARKGPINVALENGDRAVHIAAREGFLSILERLLALGADVHIANNVQDTPLYAALKAGQTETAMALLLQGAGWKDLNDDGFNALHLAVLHSANVVVRYLLRKGADPTQPDSKGRTPVKLAWHPLGKNGKKGTVDIDIMRALVDHGASPTPTDERGRTLVHLAVKEKRPGFVRLLDSKSADMNAKANDKSTPLQISINSNNLPMTRLLLELGANANGKSAHSGSPLMFAAQRGSLPIMRLLLDRGAQKFYNTPQETNAFIWACNGGHISCASFLLGCGYWPHKRAAGDYTALHYAAGKGHMEVVKWLLQLGVDKNIRTKIARVPFKVAGTAAELARAHGHIKVAEVIEAFVEEQVY